jgi:phosphate transport system protein
MRLIESDIKQLKMKLLDMAELVQQQLSRVAIAFNTMDRELIPRIQKRERKIDKIDLKIDKRCERIIALYQPVANDLRFVFSVHKINAYLELIGDLIDSSAGKILKMEAQLPADLVEEMRLLEMQVRTQEVLQLALESFFYERPNQAREVFPMDDTIDELNHHAQRVLIERMQREPERISDYLQVLIFVRHLEKIADFANHIAQETIFTCEGVTYKHFYLKNRHKLRDGELAALESQAELLDDDEVNDEMMVMSEYRQREGLGL